MNAQEIIANANFAQVRALYRGPEYDMAIEWTGPEATVRFVYSEGRGWVELVRAGRVYGTRPLLLRRLTGLTPPRRKRWVADNLVTACSSAAATVIERTKPNTFAARFVAGNRESGTEAGVWLEFSDNKARWSVEFGARTGCIWRTVILLGRPAPLVLRRRQEAS